MFDKEVEEELVDGDSDNIILKASDENDISVRQYNSENSDEYFSDVEVSGTILTITEGKKPVGAGLFLCVYFGGILRSYNILIKNCK